MSKYLTRIKISNLLLFVLFFITIYYEQIEILGGVKISHIWKILILIYILGFVLSKYSSSQLPLLIIGFFFSVKLILNASFPIGFMSDLPDAMSFLFLPAFYYYFAKKYESSPEKLQRFLFLIVFFYLASALPFFLGLLKSQGTQFNLNRYGLAEDRYGLKGLFYHVSVSSKVFSVCTLILLFGFRDYFKGSRKIFGLALIMLGVVFTYDAYTRTGWISLIVGVLVYYYYKYKNNFLRLLKKLFPFIVVFIISFIYLFSTNEAFRYRTLGETTYRKFNTLNYEAITSGRTDFIEAAIKGTFSNVPSMFFGVGKDMAIARMDLLTGIPVVAHNQFVDVWQFSGLIGLLIYLFFILSVYKEIKKYKNSSQATNILYVIWGLYIFFIIPSHGMTFWGDILFAGFLALNRNYYKLQLIDNKLNAGI